MRIDIVLKYLCLAKSRSVAKSLCDEGCVQINGEAVKAAATVHAGDFITIRWPERALIIELVEVPQKQAKKAGATDYYRVVS